MPATGVGGFGGYLFAVSVVVAFTAIGLGIRDLLMPRDLVLVLLLGVVLVAHRTTQGPALLAVALGVAPTTSSSCRRTRSSSRRPSTGF